jgi:hypothetical protein
MNTMMKRLFLDGLAGLMAYALIFVAGVVLTIAASTVVAGIVSVVLGVIYIGFGFRYHSWKPLIGVFLFIAAAIIGGMECEEYYHLSSGKIVDHVSLQEAYASQGAIGFSFRDAKVLTEYESTFVHRLSNAKRATSTQSFHAAPVVDASWNEGDEVKVFAICAYSHRCTKTWEENYLSGLRVISDEGHAFSAVQEIGADHGLAIADHPLLIKWVPSASDAVQDELHECTVIAIVFPSLWIAFIVIMMLVEWRKQKNLALY